MNSPHQARRNITVIGCLAFLVATAACTDHWSAAVGVYGKVISDATPLTVTLRSTAYGEAMRANLNQCVAVSIVRHPKTPNPLQITITDARGEQNGTPAVVETP